MPFRDKNLAKDLTQLTRLLDQSIQQNGLDYLIAKEVNLLNLACGRADETAALASVFGKQGIRMTGLDIRDRELDIARERWSRHLPDKAEVEFHVQNGTQLDDMKELHDQFEVILMRHQNFWNGDSTWMHIYDQALHRLNDKGVVVITSYFDREHRQALEALQSLGAELVQSIHNPDSRILSVAHQKSVDRHIAILRKP